MEAKQVKCKIHDGMDIVHNLYLRIPKLASLMHNHYLRIPKSAELRIHNAST